MKNILFYFFFNIIIPQNIPAFPPFAPKRENDTSKGAGKAAPVLASTFSKVTILPILDTFLSISWFLSENGYFCLIGGMSDYCGNNTLFGTELKAVSGSVSLFNRLKLLTFDRLRDFGVLA